MAKKPTKKMVEDDDLPLDDELPKLKDEDEDDIDIPIVNDDLIILDDIDDDFDDDDDY